MCKSRFTEERIVGILQEYAVGAKGSELCCKHGMMDATLYKWKTKYGGMTVSELRRLKDLEAENAELKRLLADAVLANGRKFRTANLKDDCTRECPAIDVDFSLPGERVVDMLERVAHERGWEPSPPARIVGGRFWRRRKRSAASIF